MVTNEIAVEITEEITKSIVNSGYQLKSYQSIDEFLLWYVEHPLEVCLITNESFKSKAYMELKENFPQLRDFLLVEPHEGTPEVEGHIIYIDSKNVEINIENLLSVIDSTVDQLEIAMLEGPPEDDYDITEKHTDHLGEDTTSTRESEELQPPPPVVEKQSDKYNEIREVTDDASQSVEQLEHDQVEPDLKNEIKVPIAEATPENGVKSSFQNNPFPMRMRNIQKGLSGPKMDKYKTIAVWSPLPAIGVTSFLINFSLFLSENRIHTAVLESLTSNHILKDWLKRYTSIPEKWVSLAHNLHANEAVGDSEWTYHGVKFFPLNKGDVNQEWNSDSFGAYHRMTEIYDVTLIDLPTGEMDIFTRESLKYVDELWIIVDDRVQQLNSWKDYINKIKDTYNISMYLIHNKVIDTSMPNVLFEGMDIPMLATMPALWKETARNYYQNKPLYLQKEVQPILKENYYQLATHLIGSSFQLEDKKPTMWEQIAKIGKFQKILNG